MDQKPGRARAWLLTAAAAGGLVLGAAGIASAASDTSSSTSSTSSSATNSTSRPDPASMPNGPGETLLTGDTTTKVTAAAKAAVPDATVIRVETDSDGSPYEAHLKKSDGSVVTVKIDSSFNVTNTVDGFGGGPHGQPPADASTGNA